MTESQWIRATEIFDAALDLPLSERSAFVRASSNGDAMLHAEVEGLLEADAEIAGGSFLNAGWLPPELTAEADLSLQTGEMISGRFRIVRPLGVGGMGRVYQAHDSELGVQVALKTLHPEVATNPEVIRRFHQEVRIAHRITHPNVCRTFHLDRERKHVGANGGTPVDLTFITMEYLEGETLQQILKRTGRISLSRALSIASQMAYAIEAAHQSGIIHRDIKPGNVMICDRILGGIAEERAVITDFGLAKFWTPSLNEDYSAITQTVSAMGTLAYMAPEQILLGEVTPATDVFSFGTVLFEMVTGNKAFPDSVTPSAANRRAHREAPSPREQFPELPAAWENAISGCLQLDPAARFQSSRDVIDVLTGVIVPSEPNASAVASKRRLPTHPAIAKTEVIRRNLRLLSIAITILACMSLSRFGYRFYQSRAVASVEPGTLIYLAPLKNETGEKQLDNVTELVRAGLAQSAHIKLLDEGRVGEALRKMTRSEDTVIDEPTAREIALRSGASRVILTTLTKSNGRYALHLDIQQPDSNGPSRYRAVWTNIFSWRNSSQDRELMSQSMISCLRNASDWTRIKVGESQKDVLSLNEPLEDATTNRWDALSAFARAESLDGQHKKWEAILSLQHAVQLDPHFALAFARLGDILFSVTRDNEGVVAYRHALEASTERALPRKELDRVQGMYAIDTSDYMTAIDAFRDYQAFYPNDYIGWAYPTAALRALNLDEQAVANLRKAVALEPNSSFPILTLADELIVTGHIDELSSLVSSLNARGFEAAALQLEAQRRFLIFDFDGAYRELDKLGMSNDLSRRTRSMRTRVRIAAELGDSVRALKGASEAIAETVRQGEKTPQALALEDRAALECQQKDFYSCLRDIREAISLDSGRLVLLEAEDILGPALQVSPPDEVSNIRSAIHGLERKVDSTDFGFVTRAMRSRAHAESLLADHDVTHALIEMRKVAALDAPSGSREYLGRTLIVASNTRSPGQNSKALLVEAQTAYAAAALRPQAMWTDVWNFTPGYLTEEISSYLRLTVRLGNANGATITALDFYSHLRPHSYESSKEFRGLLSAPLVNGAATSTSNTTDKGR